MVRCSQPRQQLEVSVGTAPATGLIECCAVGQPTRLLSNGLRDGSVQIDRTSSEAGASHPSGVQHTARATGPAQSSKIWRGGPLWAIFTVITSAWLGGRILAQLRGPLTSESTRSVSATANQHVFGFAS